MIGVKFHIAAFAAYFTQFPTVGANTLEVDNTANSGTYYTVKVYSQDGNTLVKTVGASSKVQVDVRDYDYIQLKSGNSSIAFDVSYVD